MKIRGDRRAASRRVSVRNDRRAASQRVAFLGLALATAASASGCIGGQVLRGYPGYPFQTFVAPAPADSVFFDLQVLLDDAGFPLDYTRREAGLINTRRADDAAEPLFLSVVVADDTAAAGSRVWVAGFVDTPGGPLRVNPNDEELWARVVDVSDRLSRSLGGDAPTGPGGP